jgi:hypothetical protein
LLPLLLVPELDGPEFELEPPEELAPDEPVPLDEPDPLDEVPLS